MGLLIHPTYFPNIETLAALLQYKGVWEVWDNFQKQTYRNRSYIATDQGKHMLNIPIKHVGGTSGRQAYRSVQVDNSYPWQRTHWRGLETAYRTAPFFEFYEEELKPLFEAQWDSLMQLNLESARLLLDLIGADFPELESRNYEPKPTENQDGRLLVVSKRPSQVAFPKYAQVFDDRHPFLPNLSGLDLLFNLGPSALEYLINLDLSGYHWDA